jgi:hypothetical protein
MDTDKQALVARIDAALELHGGDRAAAATQLGISQSDLKNEIHNTRALRVRWAQSKRNEALPPDQADAMHREVMELEPVVGGELVTEKDAQALAKEDRSLTKGLKSLGLNPMLVDLASSFQQFQSKHFSRSMEIMGGGLVRRYLMIEQAIDKVEAELQALMEGPPDDCDVEQKIAWMSSMAEREKTLRQDRQVLIELQQKAYDRVNKAALTQAIIAQKQADASNPGKRAGKPGFGVKRATQINAAAGATVVVQK